MNTYYFRTDTAMKAYNRDKWWIDPDIIKNIEIEANTISEALNQFRDYVLDKSYIEISKNAISHKSAMYVDTATGSKQIGYVITGKMDFQRGDYTWRKQYIDLWIQIDVISNPFETETTISEALSNYNIVNKASHKEEKKEIAA